MQARVATLAKAKACRVNAFVKVLFRKFNQ